MRNPFEIDTKVDIPKSERESADVYIADMIHYYKLLGVTLASLTYLRGISKPVSDEAQRRFVFEEAMDSQTLTLNDLKTDRGFIKLVDSMLEKEGKRRPRTIEELLAHVEEGLEDLKDYENTPNYAATLEEGTYSEYARELARHAWDVEHPKLDRDEVKRFSVYLETNKLKDAYRVFEENPSIVFHVSGEDLVAAIAEFRGNGMAKEANEIERALKLYAPESEKTDIVKFQQLLYRLKEAAEKEKGKKKRKGK